MCAWLRICRYVAETSSSTRKKDNCYRSRHEPSSSTSFWHKRQRTHSTKTHSLAGNQYTAHKHTHTGEHSLPTSTRCFRFHNAQATSRAQLHIPRIVSYVHAGWSCMTTLTVEIAQGAGFGKKLFDKATCQNLKFPMKHQNYLAILRRIQARTRCRYAHLRLAHT